MPSGADNFLPGNGAATDDSDSDSDAAAAGGYYCPISAESGDEDDGELGDASSSPVQSNGGDRIHYSNPDPSFCHPYVENGISTLDLNGYGGGGGGDSEEEEEEEREREESISRAFMEDESRRSAPLAPENAVRIMEAMRGVSFPGIAPDWVNHVPEDRWVDRLRSLRGESSSQS